METGFTLAPATQEEVEAHHAAARPIEAQTPQRDLTVRASTTLSEIGFDDWTTFGVKPANVATLATFDLADVHIPDGYAVPFSFYDEFMNLNGFYEQVTEMLADPEFSDDPVDDGHTDFNGHDRRVAGLVDDYLGLCVTHAVEAGGPDAASEFDEATTAIARLMPISSSRSHTAAPTSRRIYTTS